MTALGTSAWGWMVLALVAFAAAGIVWSTLATGISPMPSSRLACLAMIEAARSAPEGPVIDLGSGWGTLAIRFARAHPRRSVVGYELSIVPWAFACAAARLLGLRNLRFHRRDFREVDLAGAGVVLCYLFRDGMAELAGRLASGPGSPGLLISNTFALPGRPPSRVLQLRDFHRTRIHVYRWA